MNRLIQKENIPASLWDNEKSLLKLPSLLISEWIRLLKNNHLLEKAKQTASEGFEGGISKEETDNHFASRFTGSCARVMLAMLDPKEELSEVADAFARIFAGNKVFLADLPCGSGAATISILTTLAELRKQGSIPRMPLEIVILGGEVSEFARDYASEFLESLRTELENQAITISFNIINWNIEDKYSTANLVTHMDTNNIYSERVLIFANFSGYLTNSGKWNSCKDMIEEIFRYNSLKSKSSLIWIEPQKNSVIKEKTGLMYLLKKFLKENFPFLSSNNHSANYWLSSLEVKHPLQDYNFDVRIAVTCSNFPFEEFK